MLCWDSAATKEGSELRVPVSSFGERQDVNGTPVEESVIKLVEVRGLASASSTLTASLNFTIGLTCASPFRAAGA